MNLFWLIFSHLILPVCAGLTFLALARYATHIAPMRTLVTGDMPYKNGALGFAFFAAYLMSRPLQILLGPYPMPLVINVIREFCMMALFAPAMLVAAMSLCFGADRLPKRARGGIFGIGFVTGIVFVILNVRAVGGTEILFYIGNYPVCDGLWWKNPDPSAQGLMQILTLLRILNPIFVLLLAAVTVYRHARHYPAFKAAIYNNMPKKLYLMSAAIFVFPVSMLLTGVATAMGHPNQWWLYYLGALISGLLEIASLRLPLKSDVQVSEHAH